MPIPTPNTEEKEKEYMERCMADTVMQEYRISQRYVICYQKFQDHKE